MQYGQHGGVVGIVTGQLQGPGFNPELRLLFLWRFVLFLWCSLGSPLGSLVTSHCPKHACKQTGYTKITLAVNVCV